MTENEKNKIRHFLPSWERASKDLVKEERSILKNGFLFRHYLISRSGGGKGSCRILFFTDLHLRSAFTRSCGGGHPALAWEGVGKVQANLQEAIDLFAPSILLSGGDLTGELSAFSAGVRCLRELQSSARRFAVWGNWDKRRRSRLSRGAWLEMFRESDFSLLCNEEAALGEGVIYGLDDFKSGIPVYRSLRERNRKKVPPFQLVLAHNPDSIPFLGETPLAEETDLILCGHTHGGQILLPGIGKAVLTSTCSGNALASGVFRHKKTRCKLIVSSGIGSTWIFQRYKVPPEIVGITLEY